MTQIRALIVEDSVADAELLLRELQRGGYEVVSERVDTTYDMDTALRRSEWDIVFSDWSMPQFDATTALATLQRTGLDLPFIIISGTVGEEVVVAALRAGAHDFFAKDNLVLLLPAIEHELGDAAVRKEGARMQAQLKDQTIELRKANELLRRQLDLKNEFITAVSHELRTPLTTIVGATSELSARWADFAEDERRELTAMAHTQAVELSALVEDLLVAGRMEANTLSVAPERVVVADEMKKVIRSLDSALSERIKDSSKRAAAEVDPRRLRQILRNLLLNASRHGGPEISVTTVTRGDRVRIHVADNGDPISQEQQELIFEPFHTAAETRGPAPSVGLGLTISRSLAQAMGGDVTYHYERGRSIFVVDLPRSRSD